MSRSRWMQCALALGILVTCNGCLINHVGSRTLRDEELRQPISFETPLAAAAFDARARDSSARQATGNDRVVAVPFLFLWCTKTVRSENAYYNDQVAVCDIDNDRRITLAEAFAYNSDYYEVVAKCDTDADGWISQPEAIAHNEKSSTKVPADVQIPGHTGQAVAPASYQEPIVVRPPQPMY